MILGYFGKLPKSEVKYEVGIVVCYNPGYKIIVPNEKNNNFGHILK